MNEWLSVNEVSKETNIPDATIRRYIREHAFHLRVKKGSKSYQISMDSIEVLNRIRELYNKGLNVEQVNNVLAENKPMVITVNAPSEHDARVTINVADALIELKSCMDERMNEMSTEIIRLHQELAMHQGQLEEYNQLKVELEATRQQVAATHESVDEILALSRMQRYKKWWQFWK